MSDLPQYDEIVTIDGKQYSRLMAEEMARDIELLATVAPRAWSISDNSSLTINRPSMLIFAEPIEHGYLFEGKASDDDTARLIEEFGQAASYSQFPDITRIVLPQWSAESLRLLRSGHERAVRRVAEIAPGISPSWKWHNMARFRDLEQVVGRSLPPPAYLDEMLDWRAREVESTELSESQSFPSISRVLLDQIAAAIEVAHEVNPNSWSIYHIKGGIVLSISGYSAAHVAKERGSWMLLGNPEDGRFEELSSMRLKTDYAEIPEFLVFADERRQLESVATTYQDEFLAAVRDLAARTKTITPRTAEFQPQMLDQLGSAVGRELPRPGYEAESLIGEPSQTPTPDKRYWKISPGPVGKYWEEFRDRSLIAMHWSDELVDLATFSGRQAEFTEQAKTELGISAQGARSLWDFARVMQAGDDVLAYANQAVVGYGTVTGDYELVDDEFEYMHRRPVEWQSLESRSILSLSPDLQARLKTQATLFELTAEHFAEATSQGLVIAHSEGRRYWKVRAGTQDKYWDDMLRLGRIHHDNWAAEPIHLDQLPTDYDEFVRAITQHAGIAKPGADHYWRFMHEMKPGDLVVAVERDRSLGWAEITGECEYVNDNGLPQHQRTAEWTELAPYQISNMSMGLKDDLSGLGPRELAPPHFAEAIGATLTGYEPETGDSHLFATIRPEILQRIARDIRIAHEINGNSWALMQIEEMRASPGIVMFVGQLNTSWIRADGGGWLFYGSPDDAQFEHLDRTSMKTDYEPSIFWIRSSTQDGRQRWPHRIRIPMIGRSSTSPATYEPERVAQASMRRRQLRHWKLLWVRNSLDPIMSQHYPIPQSRSIPCPPFTTSSPQPASTTPRPRSPRSTPRSRPRGSWS